MANQEQLEILKQGVEVWNRWRKDNYVISIDLNKADLKEANLTGADLRGVDLGEANLTGANLLSADLKGANLVKANFRLADFGGANLTGANLTEADLVRAQLRVTKFTRANLWGAIIRLADLSRADLSEANLIKADLGKADLKEANLSGANLSGAGLEEVRLWEANLTGADLTGADLDSADLTGADLTGANLTESYIAKTTFGRNDLRNSLGLESVKHRQPSTIGMDTISISKGKLPVTFLRGCGLSDWEIEAAKLYNPDLSNEEINRSLYRIYDLRAMQALQISPLFISYSRADAPFVDRLEESLNEKGIRFWRDIHDATAGRLEKQIDRAIRQNPTVLLVLSKNSIKSDWVRHEVHTARALEKELERDVLCPVALDDSWQHSPWPKRLMEQVLEYNILDCSCWQDDHEFKRVFVKLVEGLNLYYKKV